MMKNVLKQQNIMTWQGMAVQLSNVSYITTRGLEQLKFLWYALIMIAIGIGLFRASFIVSIILMICGGGIIYWWYREMKRRSQSIVLTMHMNSGDKLSLLFTDQSSAEYQSIRQILQVPEKDKKTIAQMVTKHIASFSQGVLGNVLAGYINKYL